MVFTVLGAVAELERSLIIERVKAGLRNARAKAHRSPACDRGRSQDCRATQQGRVLGNGLRGNRAKQGNGAARHSLPSLPAHTASPRLQGCRTIC